MDTVNLSEEQKEAATALNVQQLSFANLWLTKAIHHMSDAACYYASGYKAKSEAARATGAAIILKRPNVVEYITKMKEASVKAAILSIEMIDTSIAEIMEADVGDYLETHAVGAPGGLIKYIPTLKCNIQDLPRAIRRQIHTVKMTPYGLEIKLYSKMDAMNLAGKRLNAFTEKREISGPNSGPIGLSLNDFYANSPTLALDDRES